MMKYIKSIALALVSVMALSLLGCSQSEPQPEPQPEPEVVQEAEVFHEAIEAKGPYFESLVELEEYSDVIVRGIRLDEEETHVSLADGYAVSGYTLSQFQITQVIDDDTGTLQKSDKITILENEYLDSTMNTVCHIAGYNMMVVGEEYLLFLTEHEMNGMTYFVSSGVNYGTISLGDDGRSESRMTRSGELVSDFSEFIPIWTAAKEKYID